MNSLFHHHSLHRDRIAGDWAGFQAPKERERGREAQNTFATEASSMYFLAILLYSPCLAGWLARTGQGLAVGQISFLVIAEKSRSRQPRTPSTSPSFAHGRCSSIWQSGLDSGLGWAVLCCAAAVRPLMRSRLDPFEPRANDKSGEFFWLPTSEYYVTSSSLPYCTVSYRGVLWSCPLRPSPSTNRRNWEWVLFSPPSMTTFEYMN
ncbi:hypothetical protein BD289DRAFT_444965 [Coniella lustricola]|uniref:Uncharacterized protein n=1 Tax=Coniella lustricola TaxID=2025994 RepID=A0A2T2ZVD9_9PEZI|nr:hypothetical protein BD289DRAFT_444965 [Coniella lustricola]